MQSTPEKMLASEIKEVRDPRDEHVEQAVEQADSQETETAHVADSLRNAMDEAQRSLDAFEKRRELTLAAADREGRALRSRLVYFTAAVEAIVADQEQDKPSRAHR